MVRVLAACVLLAVSAGCMRTGPQTTQVGASTPRLAVQQAVASRLDMPVTLDVQTATAYRDWVFLAGRPLAGDGRPIDYTRTPFAPDLADGVFDDQFSALVRHRAAPGAGWGVVELSIGATDAPFVDWFERYGLPLDLASRADETE
jgi:hypothetical protein